MGDKQEPVVVFESDQPVEISMARQLLEAAEIPCATNTVGNVSAMSVLGGDNFGSGQVVQVPADLAEKARGILEKAWGEAEGGE